ncbi:MAG: hypothetical protein LC624_12500 [Halobacteriales archaeon]|nr:hypothetical protein [Halobacteriales archaeon]
MRILLLAFLALLVLPAMPAHALPIEACVPLYSFPDNGLALCVAPTGPCLVIERRETFIGPVDTCLLPSPL